jgi:hypothetical protein
MRDVAEYTRDGGVHRRVDAAVDGEHGRVHGGRKTPERER